MEFVRNAWYAAAAAGEVTRDLLRRILLNDPVVLYRTEGGRAVALADRCAHRYAPLSRGTLVGDQLQCGYHGLRYATNGACVHNPHASSIPPGSSIKAYPVLERYGFVWIWPGDPRQADAALLPDLAPFDATDGYCAQGGYLSIKAHYQLIIDNLLDLSHVDYLHPSFTSGGAIGNTDLEVIERDGVVMSNRWKPDCLISPLLARCWGRPQGQGDARSCIRWHPPGIFFHEIGATDVGASVREGVTVWLLHLLTPATASTTHYFWGATRNRQIDDEALTTWIGRITNDAFMLEDEPMIEAQQDNIGEEHDVNLSPVYLPPDLALIKARRIIGRLLAAEQSAQANARRPRT